MATLHDVLIKSLRAASAHSRGAQVAPAAVLWPDADRQWSGVAASLRGDMPQLFVLGDYTVSERRGPAIWLKCVVARTVLDVEFPKELVPVLYLPGVARTDLRAIEQCSQALQPLADLQYRGTFWSQQNAKDWTLMAFLVSDKGGAGLDVVEDTATRQALRQVAEEAPERLLGLKVLELIGKRLDAQFFNNLLSPDPAQDLLTWMNDPKAVREKWLGARWKIFVERCRSDYGFHPEKDGDLVAAEKLAAHEGAWSNVFALYKDLHRKFSNLYDLLSRVNLAPDMFTDHSGYPSANAEAEKKLRTAFVATKDMGRSEVSSAILALEGEHGQRRTWLWSDMGRAPLAAALLPLSELAAAAAKPFGGADVNAMATQYRDGLWKVDDAALRALATVKSKEDAEAVQIVLRALYVPWLDAAASKFQDLVKQRGGLNAKQPSASYAAGECLVFVDGLRYDVAHRLVKRLAVDGVTASLRDQWSATPSVTSSGKAMVSPVADKLAGSTQGTDFEPIVQDGGAATTPALRKLMEKEGWQVLNGATSGDPKGKAWTECGDLDHYGHEHGIRLARDIDSQLDAIAERIRELIDSGWKKIRIVTDHGWLLVPGGLPKVELHKVLAESRWGRCAALRQDAKVPYPVFAWDWNPAVQVAVAPGISSFIAGAEYAHGGLTLQESMVPVIEIRATKAASVSSIKILEATWQGLRCRVKVEGTVTEIYADLRLKAADPSSSVIEQNAKTPGKAGKKIEDGQVSLAARDDKEGVAASLVIIDGDGTILAKCMTTVGE